MRTVTITLTAQVPDDLTYGDLSGTIEPRLRLEFDGLGGKLISHTIEDSDEDLLEDSDEEDYEQTAEEQHRAVKVRARNEFIISLRENLSGLDQEINYKHVDEAIRAYDQENPL